MVTLKLPSLQLQAPYRIALAVTGLLLLSVWVVRYLYLPVIARIGSQRAELHALSVKVADADVLAAALPDYKAALGQAESRYQALERRVAGQSVARILDELGRWAKSHKLEVVAVQPRPETGTSAILEAGQKLRLRELPLTLKLRGRYRQVGEFLAKLPDAPFFGTVRQLNIRQPISESASLEVDMVLAVYLNDRKTP
jgi:Tfp pilus assembly protein PilO